MLLLGGDRGGGGFRGTCYNCGEAGHLSRNCPSGGGGRGAGQPRFRGACHRCGEEGHYANSCPNGGGGERDFGRSGNGFGGSFGGGGGGMNFGGDDQHSFQISSDDVGRIIGKGGCKIRELEEESGARIKVITIYHFA